MIACELHVYLTFMSPHDHSRICVISQPLRCPSQSSHGRSCGCGRGLLHGRVKASWTTVWVWRWMHPRTWRAMPFGTSLFGTQAASLSSAEMGRCMLFGGTHLRTDIQPLERLAITYTRRSAQKVRPSAWIGTSAGSICAGKLLALLNTVRPSTVTCRLHLPIVGCCGLVPLCFSRPRILHPRLRRRNLRLNFRSCR